MYPPTVVYAIARIQQTEDLGRAPGLSDALAAVVDEVRDPTRDDDVAALVVRRES